MLTGSGRLVALALGAFLLAGAAGVAWLFLPPRQTNDVAEPAPGATPEAVVTAYLDALNAHDCDTAEAMMADGGQESARSWCERVARLSSVVVEEHVAERPEYSGRAAPDEVVRVPVTFDLDWRPLRSDASMNEGATAWGYLLVRGSPDAPWRIVDQGPV